ncbi:hypothetical protein FRC15_008923 [Serendipita sp. 397]|nr:hypothetical protein FRC15_008923 [Serendipita sp. 397]
MESDTTSHLRPSILTSFLSRGSRPRSTAASPTGAEPPNSATGNASHGVALGNGSGNNRRRMAAAAQNGAQSGQTQAPSLAVGSLPASALSMPGPTATSFSQMLRRRRSNNGNLANAANAANAPANASNSAVNNAAAGASVAPQTNGSGNTPANASTSANNNGNFGPAHRIRLVPHIDAQRALHFDPIIRECKEGAPAIRIGRFTDRSGTLAASTNSLTGKIAFKSKVVSRGHAELWCEAGAKFYVKDTSSSSGTFLNHMRLSHAGVESRPFSLKDGDILQLGVDYQGGTEEIYRCVKIRVEIGREWQAGPNPFNTNALAQLKALSNLTPSASAPAGTSAGATRTKAKKSATSDCCICLFPVTVCQALFIAPCSHSFHYKCIRGTLVDRHPNFSCPLCRSFHNLDADVEIEMEEEDEWEELPEAAPTPAGNVDADADVEGEGEVSAMMQDAAIADDSVIVNPVRSMDEDEDIHYGFRTAAEDTGRNVLLPQGRSSFQQEVPNLPPPPNATPRRVPRRGTITQGTPGPFASEDIDRGFETDVGVVGFGAETDMDIDGPSRSGDFHPGGGRGHQRTGSGRNRSTIYNLVHGAANSPPSNPNVFNNSGSSSNGHAFGGSTGMSSAPNLLRPGSSLGNHSQQPLPSGSAVNSGNPLPGTATPPNVVGRSEPYPVRAAGSSNQLAYSGSHNSGPRASLPSSLPSGSATHLFGDTGAAEDRPHGIEDVISLEDQTIETAAATAPTAGSGGGGGGGGGGSGLFGFGSKRKR